MSYLFSCTFIYHTKQDRKIALQFYVRLKYVEEKALRQKKESSIHREVLDYLNLGINVSLNGRNINSCDRGVYSIKENTCYMREYIRNVEGDLAEINFTTIKKK